MENGVSVRPPVQLIILPISLSGYQIITRYVSSSHLFLGRLLGIAGNVTTSRLLELAEIILILVGDTGLEGVVGVGLDEELAHGVEHGADPTRGLPVLGL